MAKPCKMCDSRLKVKGSWYCLECSRNKFVDPEGAQARRYGITVDELRAMHEEQGGRCAICGGDNNGRTLAVDHDHSCCPGLTSCGECVRGLLCMGCNTALGAMKDDPKVLRSAAQYLEGW